MHFLSPSLHAPQPWVWPSFNALLALRKFRLTTVVDIVLAEIVEWTVKTEVMHRDVQRQQQFTVQLQNVWRMALPMVQMYPLIMPVAQQAQRFIVVRLVPNYPLTSAIFKAQAIETKGAQDFNAQRRPRQFDQVLNMLFNTTAHGVTHEKHRWRQWMPHGRLALSTQMLDNSLTHRSQRVLGDELFNLIAVIRIEFRQLRQVALLKPIRIVQKRAASVVNHKGCRA